METIIYIEELIEELIEEFGIQHPIVEKTLNEFVNVIEQLIESGQSLSEGLFVKIGRFYDRYMGRRDKAVEEQQLQAQEKSNLSLIGGLIAGVALLVLLFFYIKVFDDKSRLKSYTILMVQLLKI